MGSKLAFFVLVLSLTQSAYGLFDVQLLGGYNMGKLGDAEMGGVRMEAAFHLSPIPLVPIGVGVGVEFTSFNTDSGDLKDANIDTASEIIIVPELYAWLPFDLVSVAPYVKLGYGIGQYTYEGGSGATKIAGTSKLTGIHASLGVQWEPPMIPLLKVLLEYEYINENAEADEFKIGGNTATKPDDSEFAKNSISLGVQLGI